MKRFLFATGLTIAIAITALAQKTNTRAVGSATNETSAQKQGKQINLQSATQLAAQLQGALDAKHAKVGDRVVLKTTQAIKENGQVIIPKGAQLIGHVTDVQQQSKSSGESHIGLLFDQLKSGSSQIPITASIISVTQARSSAQVNNGVESDPMARSSTSTRTSSSGNSGLLGGVGNTVGGVVNTTTNAAGNVSGTTTGAVGSAVGATTNTARSLTGSLSGLQITQSTDTSAQGGSTLSLTGRNLRLESGTTFQLSVSNSTSAGTTP